MDTAKIKFGIPTETYLNHPTSGTASQNSETQVTRIEFDCEICFRGLSQGFLVTAIIYEMRYDQTKLASQARTVVLNSLTKKRIWDLFQPSEIVVEPTTRELRLRRAEICLERETVDHFEAQAQAGNAAKREWQAALEELKRTLNKLPSDDFHQTTVLLAFLTNCENASALSRRGTYRGIEADLLKLRSYKYPKGPHFEKRSRKLKTTFLGLQPCNTWRTAPPTRAIEPGGRDKP